jgi:hypothetical protein
LVAEEASESAAVLAWESGSASALESAMAMASELGSATALGPVLV